MYHGDIRLGDTIDIKFSTRRFSTGAPFTLAGTPAVAAYPGNSVTEITAGITLTVDFDGRTGLHNVRIVASGANGYATATNYTLVVTAGTVDSVSVVGEVIGSFSIENRSPVMPTTAGRTLDVSTTGEAGVDWANVGSPTTTVGLSGTTVKAVTDGVTVATNNDKTGYGLSAAAVLAIWDALTSALTIAGSIGKRLADNVDAAISTRSSHAAADVWSVGSRTLTGFVFAVDISAGAVTLIWDKLTSALTTAGSIGKLLVDNINATISSRSTHTAADVRAEMDANSGDLNTIIAYVDELESRLTAARAANLDTDAIASQVWNRLLSSHTVAGSFGERLQHARRGTAQAGAATSITLDAGASATNDLYKGLVVFLVAGTGAGQARVITAYNGSSKVATVAAWATNPDVTSVFMILPVDLAGSSAGLIADAVWDEAIADHLAAGSTGQKLNAAGGAADPLTNQVPGTYAAGTAGVALGRIGSGQITTTSPVAQSGDVEIVKGDDYLNANGRSLEWTNASGTWPDLTSATILIAVTTGFTKAGSVVTPTGSQKVRVELSRADTVLTTLPEGKYEFEIEATLSSTNVVRLVRGTITILPDIG